MTERDRDREPTTDEELRAATIGAPVIAQIMARAEAARTALAKDPGTHSRP